MKTHLPGRRNHSYRLFVSLSVIPAIVLYTVFMVYPAASVFRMALYRWGGYSGKRTFVGFNNFKLLLSDERFIRSVQNSLMLIVTVSVATLVTSLFFAAVMTRLSLRMCAFFRVVFYIPSILSMVVIAAVFSAVYDPTNGLIAPVTKLFTGGDPILWLGDRRLAVFSIAAAMVWQAVGYYMVMYTAAMSSVPKQLYEAASLEGAGEIRKFFTVTLPLIWNEVRTTLTFFIVSNINISFLIVRAMTGGGPDGASNVFLSYMYEQAYTNSSYGYGMAIAAIVFIFSLVLSLAVRLASKRELTEY